MKDDDEKQEFKMCESCHIDNGELAEISPEKAFILGVEWEMIRTLLKSGGGIAKPLHPGNASRIRLMLQEKCREFRITHMHEDSAEYWLWLEVAPADHTPEPS